MNLRREKLIDLFINDKQDLKKWNNSQKEN